MKHVSIVQHTQSEWLGLIEDHLEGRRIRFSYFRPFTSGGSLPNADVIGDGLMLVGGGPWGTVSGSILPTLQEEVRLARTCLMLEKPVIGFGLGAQIICLAADGATEPAPLRLDVVQAQTVRDGALGGFAPKTFPSISYMRDRIVPPDYAEIVATDANGEPLVFQIGSNAFGFAGHPGLKVAMIEDLIMEFEDSPDDAGQKLSEIRTLKTEIEDALVPIMTGLIQATGWMRQGD
ncbi:MAG: hypothetical protein ACR2O4_02920 [Hyphomicrobiaceae bacterium]